MGLEAAKIDRRKMERRMHVKVSVGCGLLYQNSGAGPATCHRSFLFLVENKTW